MMFDYLVIGAGLIGSAAVRYLSQGSNKVALIGPDEPADWVNHEGVFASHYDQGRIARVLSSDRVWAVLAQRSIAEYRAIETQSGIPFYVPCGGVQVGLQSSDRDDFISKTAAVGESLGIDFAKLTAVTFSKSCPTLQFPDEYIVLQEDGAAGYVNPRALVAAQCQIARMQETAVISETVTSISKQPNFVTVQIQNGNRVQARKVLIAAGAYSNQLLDSKLDLRRKPRTIILARLSASELARLQAMPTVIYHDLDHPELESVYMLPPIQYPDGHYYLKMGGAMRQPAMVETDRALLDWFHAEGSQREADALQEVMFSIVPQLNVEGMSRKACVVTGTRSKRPFIDIITPNQIYVAAGGCGSAAKSSNEIGRLAAELMQHQ